MRSNLDLEIWKIISKVISPVALLLTFSKYIYIPLFILIVNTKYSNLSLVLVKSTVWSMQAPSFTF